jgi:hypothetical protein
MSHQIPKPPIKPCSRAAEATPGAQFQASERVTGHAVANGGFSAVGANDDPSLQPVKELPNYLFGLAGLVVGAAVVLVCLFWVSPKFTSVDADLGLNLAEPVAVSLMEQASVPIIDDAFVDVASLSVALLNADTEERVMASIVALTIPSILVDESVETSRVDLQYELSEFTEVAPVLNVGLQWKYKSMWAKKPYTVSVPFTYYTEWNYTSGMRVRLSFAKLSGPQRVSVNAMDSGITGTPPIGILGETWLVIRMAENTSQPEIVTFILA